jgi:hypothetical protein
VSQPVKLSDIEYVNVKYLKDYKLKALQDGNSPSGLITLQRASGTPYKILDGNHRIYIARENGKSLIEAIFDDER